MKLLSETAKQRHLTWPYVQGNGVDVGSGGDPVVPWAISLDIPSEDYQRYTGGLMPDYNINFRGDALLLPFKDGVLDFCYSSHVLEDFRNWGPYLKEWTRVIKTTGFLVILVPDKERFAERVRLGLNFPNCAHKHEAKVGELSTYAPNLGLQVIEDRFCDSFPGDYNILFVARKVK